ncbi:TPA: FkbM family methyltransferase, partial [Escherichia coli]
MKEVDLLKIDTQGSELNILVGGEQVLNNTLCIQLCVFRSIRSRIGIEVRSAIRIHSINRELNFFYRFLT